MCVYSGALYDCYKVVVFLFFFVFATILARTCIACCLRKTALVWLRLLSGHHLHELIKINSSRTVGIDFIDHAIQIVIR